MLKHTKKVRKITYILGFTSIILGLITLVTVFVVLQSRKGQAETETNLVSTPATCQELVEQIITPAEFKNRY